MRFTKRVYQEAVDKARAEYNKANRRQPCEMCGEPAQQDWWQEVGRTAHRLGKIRARALREKGLYL